MQEVSRVVSYFLLDGVKSTGRNLWYQLLAHGRVDWSSGPLRQRLMPGTLAKPKHQAGSSAHKVREGCDHVALKECHERAYDHDGEDSEASVNAPAVAHQPCRDEVEQTRSQQPGHILHSLRTGTTQNICRPGRKEGYVPIPRCNSRSPLIQRSARPRVRPANRQRVVTPTLFDILPALKGEDSRGASPRLVSSCLCPVPFDPDFTGATIRAKSVAHPGCVRPHRAAVLEQRLSRFGQTANCPADVQRCDGIGMAGVATGPTGEADAVAVRLVDHTTGRAGPAGIGGYNPLDLDASQRCLVGDVLLKAAEAPGVQAPRWRRNSIALFDQSV